MDWLTKDESRGDSSETTALVIAWSAEPQRLGELTFIPEESDSTVLGRGEGDAGETRARFYRQRPGVLSKTPLLAGASLSRRQLLLSRTDRQENGLAVERIGSCPLLINGAVADRAEVTPGDVVTLKHELVLFCVRRPQRMPPLLSLKMRGSTAFGDADEHGFVGESAAAWEVRDQLAFCATSDRHVLLLGESGSGKELAAGAVHRLSERQRRAMVSRNAATFPAGLIDAELFGNVKDYPNPRMAARSGVIGEADGSSLFLDEIGELPGELQAHLLRVLDSGGEYQRLGDAQVRCADLRLIAATNRDPTELKHDLLARLTLRLTLPSLRDRREDIPLLMRHLLRLAAQKNERIRSRFFEHRGTEPDELGEARVHPNLVEALLTHAYTHNVRELDALLWRAIAGSKGNFIDLTPEVLEETRRDESLSKGREGEPTAEEIRDCLALHDGNVSKAWVDLGLKSRYALYRLIKKHDLSIR